MALAFADASVVVLALPAMYGEFDTTIVGVAWVITAYGLALSVTGLAAAIAPRRGDALHLTLVGLALFALSSVGCAIAPGLGSLIAGRAVQGVGAALLLIGALHLLQTRIPGTGQRLWGSATTVGLALGPALGGVLTELFDWRAIFVAQAPVAFAALGVGFSRGERQAEPRPERTSSLAETTLANAGLLLVSGALVGALFLGVLVVIEVWRYSPIGGAAVVSTLPVGALAAGALRRRAAATLRGLTGPVVLAAGLVGLAFLPSASAWWAAAALGLCGAGLGLSSAVVDLVTDREWSASRRAVGLEVGCRHAGLVLGLLLIAPLLSDHLDRGAEEATSSGTALVLDARIPLDVKLNVAEEVRDEVDRTPRGQVPDVERAFADTDEATARVGVALQARIEDVLTRAFRGSFLVAAGLALAAVVPTVLFAALTMRGRSGPRPLLGRLALAGLVAGAGGLVSAELAAGGATFGEYNRRDPCTTTGDPYPGRGLDATAQRIVLGGLDGAACDLEITREELVLSLQDDTGLGTVDWDRPTMERAVRAGLVRAIDDAAERGSLPEWAAPVLKEAVERVPVSLLLESADLLREGVGDLDRLQELIDTFLD